MIWYVMRHQQEDGDAFMLARIKRRISSNLEIEAKYSRRYAPAIRSVAGSLTKWLIPASDRSIGNPEGMCSRATHWGCDSDLAPDSPMSIGFLSESEKAIAVQHIAQTRPE